MQVVKSPSKFYSSPLFLFEHKVRHKKRKTRPSTKLRGREMTSLFFRWTPADAATPTEGRRAAVAFTKAQRGALQQTALLGTHDNSTGISLFFTAVWQKVGHHPTCAYFQGRFVYCYRRKRRRRSVCIISYAAVDFSARSLRAMAWPKKKQKAETFRSDAS